jgi:hypothetical protein
MLDREVWPSRDWKDKRTMSYPMASTAEALKVPLAAKPQKTFAIAFVVLATVLAGCASGLGATSVGGTAAVGMVTRVEEGHVVGSRSTADNAHAYTVRLRTGELVQIEQASAYAILEGTPVVIEYGAQARVIPQNASIGYL